MILIYIALHEKISSSGPLQRLHIMESIQIIDLMMLWRPAVALPCSKQVYVPKAATGGGQSILRQGKLSLFLPSNASLREHLQFGVLAKTECTTTQVLLVQPDCRGLQSAAGFADCSMSDPGWMCPVIMPATDNCLFCWLKRNTNRRGKQTTTGYWPCFAT